jgi:GNAT superfamily N-acetyltransferase
MLIRDYVAADESGLHSCLIELQDTERAFHPKAAEGREIAQEYFAEVFQSCVRQNGKIFVAEIDRQVIGYTVVLARIVAEEIHEISYEYAYISDLLVLSTFRGRGVGRRLLEAAENFARDEGAGIIRIGALAKNKTARQFYGYFGFEDYEVMLEKTLDR